MSFLRQLQSSSNKPSVSRKPRPLSIERLETRQLLAAYEVTTLQDIVDENDSFLSLREAVESANSQSGEDTITFASSLTKDSPGVIDLALGEIIVNESLTIAGPGADRLSIDAGDASRVMTVDFLFGRFTLSGLTLTGGRTSSDNAIDDDTTNSGGAIRFLSNGTLTLENSRVIGNMTEGDRAFGGGIFSPRGTIQLTGTTIANNTTIGARSSGGGIHAGSGAVHIVSSTLSGNVTQGVDADGGGIAARAGRITLVDSTVSGNQTFGLAADGGGIDAHAGEILILRSTIVNNHATGSFANGGGIFIPNTVDNPEMRIVLSIVAQNTATVAGPDFLRDPDVMPVVWSSLIGDNTDTGLASSPVVDLDGNPLNSNPLDSNRIGNSTDPIDPRLGPLQDNGGITWTHAILENSPARNAASVDDGGLEFGGIDTTALPDFDQRGEPYLRVVGDAIDIGAYELQVDTSQPPGPSRSWHNSLIPGDVDNNGIVSSADALAIIFELNQPRYSASITSELISPNTVDHWPSLYFDRNADHHVSALDALLVINDIYIQDSFSENVPEAEIINCDDVASVNIEPLTVERDHELASWRDEHLVESKLF